MIARIISFVFCSLIVFVSQAQQSLLQSKISVNSKSGNAKEVLEFIEKTSQIQFVYSDNLFEEHTFPEKKYDSVSIENFLIDYFKDQEIGYKILGNQIILFFKEYIPKWYTQTGFIKDNKTGEDLIGATIYCPELNIGAITNSYGFYSIKLPEGKQRLLFNCLSYDIQELETEVISNRRINIFLSSKSYRVKEITINSKSVDYFLESELMNMSKIDISTLQELPGLFGENDALRNLSLFPGIQTNELSTSSINVRGGSTDQTVFLMDEANVYNASHFGGLFSVFNPDVVNNVNVYKSDIPVSEGGALSSLIDVRLREGNNNRWKVSGGLGLISARASVEGPIIKESASILFAFRRTYVDKVIQVLATDQDLKNLNFYFYDTNLKMNFKLNKNNRIFVSGYSGADSFDRYSKIYRANHLGTIRWNHLFGSNLFSNTTFIVSRNIMTQSNTQTDDILTWQSDAYNFKIKTDLTFYKTDVFESSFGYNGNLYNIDPFTVLSETEGELFTRFQSVREQLLLNSLYYSQHILIKKKISIDAGIRLSHMFTVPFIDSVVGLKEWFIEPQLKVGFTFRDNSTIKASVSRQIQPLHQLPTSMIGVSINRWMTANETFKPQESINYSFGYYKRDNSRISFSSEVYYRKMNDLIETFGNLRIIFTDEPYEHLYHSSGESYGAEFLLTYKFNKIKGIASYDYCKSLWITDGYNNNKQYPASHTREHSLTLSGIYSLNNRITLSATWTIASGLPFTAPVDKYSSNGRMYWRFDKNKINTRQLPAYHRLDLSLDIASKKNDTRKWKSYWNFAIYNAYFHKNALGVAYFVPDAESGEVRQDLQPGYYYLYQFVPSVSYRFNF
ncbi:MAG: TonB-dependent receptor [Salinivirgaceae bacterium]|nr:TonB-dependent receptor [Salinivirgaceae bacterium]